MKLRDIFRLYLVISMVSGGAVAGQDLMPTGKAPELGARLQAIAEEEQGGGQDLYLRRARINVKYNPWEGHRFVFDLRNDNINSDDRGEGGLRLGDAYWQIDLDGAFLNNIKLFKAKVDVSYSASSSSKHLFHPYRPESVEYASDFVIHGRRAANIQVNGNWGRLAYQAALSDGVHSDDLEVLQGSAEAMSVERQKFTYGGKLRYYFAGDPRKNATQETFYGKQDSFSVGAGVFRNERIEIKSGAESLALSRALINAELSWAKGGWRFLGEYFHFDGSIFDPSSPQERDRQGESEGYYGRLERVIGKWAPFVGYERMNWRLDRPGHQEEFLSAGLNYFWSEDSLRMGASYRKSQPDRELGKDKAEAFYTYLMLAF